jgi:hypothetical protein
MTKISAAPIPLHKLARIAIPGDAAAAGSSVTCPTSLCDKNAAQLIESANETGARDF